MDRIEHIYHLLDVAEPFKGKPRLYSVMIPVFRQAQEIEDMFHALQAMIDLETADLTRLKLLADFVGQPVITSDLETLRKLVKVRILINMSHGRRSDLIKVLDTLGLGAYTRTWSTFDAGVEVVFDDEVDALVAQLLEEAAASGVYVRGLSGAAVNTPYILHFDIEGQRLDMVEGDNWMHQLFTVTTPAVAPTNVGASPMNRMFATPLIE